MLNDTRTSCPVCGSTSTTLLLPLDADVFECADCSHVFSSLTPDTNGEQYEEVYYEEVHENWFRNPNTRLFRWICGKLSEDCTSVLDVGCGKGAFLRFMRDRSLRPLTLIGVDYSPNAPERGIAYREGAFEEMEDLGSHDAVVSLAVIEHLESPADFAVRLAEHCREKGVVVVMTLNNDSVLYCIARLLARIGIKGPIKRLYSVHHLQHFTKRSLETTLKKSGLEILEIRNHNVPLKAVDIPVKNPMLRPIVAACVFLVFLLGTASRRTYLQTVVATPVRSSTI